jgi:hypothetical protein
VEVPVLENATARKVVEAVRARLAALEREPGPDIPPYDVLWLKERCESTLRGGNDYWCRLSLRQLKKDVANFDKEFPGLLDPDLLMALENLPVCV